MAWAVLCQHIQLLPWIKCWQTFINGEGQNKSCNAIVCSVLDIDGLEQHRCMWPQWVDSCPWAIAMKYTAGSTWWLLMAWWLRGHQAKSSQPPCRFSNAQALPLMLYLYCSKPSVLNEDKWKCVQVNIMVIDALVPKRHQDNNNHCVDSICIIYISTALTHLPLDKMAAFSQAIFSDAFSRMKSCFFWLKFHWSLFLGVQLTITQHWFR